MAVPKLKKKGKCFLTQLSSQNICLHCFIYILYINKIIIFLGLSIGRESGVMRENREGKREWISGGYRTIFLILFLLINHIYKFFILN